MSLGEPLYPRQGPSWLEQQLKHNRDFSAGWNSALWEVRKLLPDDTLELAGLVNHIDRSDQDDHRG